MFSSISKGMFKRPAKDGLGTFGIEAASAVANGTTGLPEGGGFVAGSDPVRTLQTEHLAQGAAPDASAHAGELTAPFASILHPGKAPYGSPLLAQGRLAPRGSTDQSNVTGREGYKMSNAGGGPRILSVGGGKGGIGKSFFSANLAVSLTRLGYKVALVDLDLGSANLHTCLGVPSPKVGLFDFVSGQAESLEDVAVSGGVPGLTLYGGGQEFWQQIRPHSVQKIKLISKLQRLDADYVILDLGAGTHVNTLDFFIFSHAGIVVVVPEPTSIENAYVFLKSVLFRKLQSVVKAIRQEEATDKLIAALGDPKIPVPPLTQLQKFATENPEVGQKVLQLINMTQLGVVMNQVRSKGDADIGTSITQICKRYFGFNAEFIGSTAYDDTVWKSVRSRRPVCVDYPDSPVALSLQEIADSISRAFLPSTQGVQGVAR